MVIYDESGFSSGAGVPDEPSPEWVVTFHSELCPLKVSVINGNVAVSNPTGEYIPLIMHPVGRDRIELKNSAGLVMVVLEYKGVSQVPATAIHAEG